MINLTEKDIERFWACVDKSNDCWEWKLSRKNRRYGDFNVGGRKGRKIHAHRIAYSLCKEQPGKLNVCHKCDNTFCVNPDHLFLGTQKDNMQDCAAKGRCRTVPRPGEMNPMAKLKIEQVREIRYLGQTGKYTHQQIADRVGVHRRNVSKIISGHRWGSVS